jgi:hypothetical protein
MAWSACTPPQAPTRLIGLRPTQLYGTLPRFEPSEIDGIWAGTLTYGSIRLRLVFYIANGPHGLIATMKSCDQGDAMISMSSAKLVGRTVVLEAEGIRATLEGKLDQNFGTIDGTWT